MRGIVLMLLGSILMLAAGCAHQPVAPDPEMLQRMEHITQAQQQTEQRQQELELAHQDLQNQLFELEARLSKVEFDAMAMPSQNLPSVPITELAPDSGSVSTTEPSPRSDSISPTEMVPASSGVPAVAAKTPTVALPTDADLEYEQALQLYLSGQVEEGHKALQAYKDSHPQSPLIPNVLYWLGESLIDQKHFDQAILTFKQVPQNYPNHPKIPDALFKIVTCYMALGDQGNSGFYKGILLHQYPRSSAARLAKKRFSQLLPNQ